MNSSPQPNRSLVILHAGCVAPALEIDGDPRSHAAATLPEVADCRDAVELPSRELEPPEQQGPVSTNILSRTSPAIPG